MMMGGRLEANVEEDLFKVGTDTMLQYAHFLLRLVEFCVSPTQKEYPSSSLLTPGLCSPRLYAEGYQ